jgi:hypothetical protein
MEVDLLSLTFNHDPESTREAALNIRVNGSEPVQLPEWVAGRTRQYPAAYSIEDTAATTVFIEATLAGPPNSVLSVRAVPSTFFLGDTHVLGPIAPQPVAFDEDGLSGTVRFRLTRPSFSVAGVGAHEVRWQWLQKSDELEPWTQFAETSHLIFTVLRVPTLPWVQQPFVNNNTQLPWSDVLQWACRWAALSRHPAIAATQITLAIFAQGGERIRYGCQSGGASNYSSPEFDCTGFLERLAGGFGRGSTVNCSDCATFVSTFANVLGCDLWQSQMFHQLTPFAVNNIQMIGQGSFGPVCGRGLFNYHEVAWEGLCNEQEQVYDACVALWARPAPFLPFGPLIPAGIPFGWPNQGFYRDLLAQPGSRSVCQPQPALSRRRRLVY